MMRFDLKIEGCIYCVRDSVHVRDLLLPDHSYFHTFAYYNISYVDGIIGLLHICCRLYRDDDL